MTGLSPAEYQQLGGDPGGSDRVEWGLSDIIDAASAAAAVLPASAPLTAGDPSPDPAAALLPGMAACARFSGAAQGEVVIVVAQDLVDALHSSPLGELDVAKAVQPALQAAAATFGPVVVDPATVMEPQVALESLIAKGEAVFVPLEDGDVVRAAMALVVTARVAAPPLPPAGPAGPAAVPAGRDAGSRGLDLLHGVEMEVTAELGRTRMTVRELLSLSPGAIVELDRSAGSPADLLVNGRLIATGEVVVIDENFGLRITEIVAPGAQ